VPHPVFFFVLRPFRALTEGSHVSDWPLPPYLEPHGRHGDDESVVRAWVREEIAPFSDRLHVEGPVLMVERDVAAGLRLDLRSVLVRMDLPEASLDILPTITDVLTSEGLSLVDPDNQLAISVAMQMVALRISTWDLWGIDPELARTALDEAAMGGRRDVLVSGEPLFRPTGDP